MSKFVVLEYILRRVKLKKKKPALLLSSGLAILLALVALLAIFGEAEAANPEQTKGNADAGKQKFSVTCTGCHLNNGLSAGRAPLLAGKAREESFIRNQVRNGGTRMPPFGTDKVSDDDLTNLVAYVQSLATATPIAAPATTAAAAPAPATTAAATTATAPAPVKAPAAGLGGSTTSSEFSLLWLILPLALGVGLSDLVLKVRKRKSN